MWGFYQQAAGKDGLGFPEADRVHTLFPDEIPEKMWPLPVRNLLFLGKASEQKLLNQGIVLSEIWQRNGKQMCSYGLEKSRDISSGSMPEVLMIRP